MWAGSDMGYVQQKIQYNTELDYFIRIIRLISFNAKTKVQKAWNGKLNHECFFNRLQWGKKFPKKINQVCIYIYI